MAASNMSCNAIGYAVGYEVRFGIMKDGIGLLYGMPDHGTMLVGNNDAKQFFMDAIRGSVLQALTDYLKTSFD